MECASFFWLREVPLTYHTASFQVQSVTRGQSLRYMFAASLIGVCAKGVLLSETPSALHKSIYINILLSETPSALYKSIYINMR